MLGKNSNIIFGQNIFIPMVYEFSLFGGPLVKNLKVMPADTHEWNCSWRCCLRVDIWLPARAHYWRGISCIHFGSSVLVSTCFLQSFRAYGSKSKIWSFVLGCTWILHRNKLREDNNEWYNKEEDHYSAHNISLD